MENIYNKVKTPFKYGPVVEPSDSKHMTDCPTVFRMHGVWYMTYVVFNGDGYETWIAKSDDLLHWKELGCILPFRKGSWDEWQACGFPAFIDMKWGGKYELESWQGRYWMSYFGGPTKGYESRPLSLGLASVDAKTLSNALKNDSAVLWERSDKPIMTSTDYDSQSWESGCQYKSSLYRDNSKLTGHKFLLYYNAYGTDSVENRGAERIGLAFSDDMKTWSRYAGNPIVAHRSKYDKWGITGDPQIQRFKVNGKTIYVMFYFRAIDGSDKNYQAYNTFACSTDLIHWTDWDGKHLIKSSEDFDNRYAHKSFVVNWKGVTYHFYCAVNNKNKRCIAVATSENLKAKDVIYSDFVEDLESWKNAKWIALEKDSEKIIPGVHIPLIKKTFGTTKPGMYRMPVFAKSFQCGKNIRTATLIVCGLGQFEAFINDEKVGNHFLDPGWTLYDKEAEYVAFDVKDMLQKGENMIKIMLGNGFYNIPRERYAKLIQSYGAPKLKALMHIVYRNGKETDIPTDITWNVKESPIKYSSIYGGESYDARIEKTAVGKTPVIVEQDIKLKEQKQPVTYHEVLKPVNEKKMNSNIVVYDFGQNAAGIPRITVKGKPGDMVTLKPGELQKSDGSAWNSVASKYFYTYAIADTLEHTWQPQFSYFGFRYLEVEKSRSDMMCSNVEFVTTYADVEEVGQFHCSDSLLNKIHSLIDWAIKSNTQSISTDCPTREKLGWLEQSYLMQESMMYRYDMRKLFIKIMDDMASSQHDNGCIPTIAPEYVDFGDAFSDTPEWGSAFIILPWKYYLWYGDDSLIRKYYGKMTKYIDYLTSRKIITGEKSILAYGLGDWYDIGPNRPGYSQLTSNGVTATATYFYDLSLLSKMAKNIGKKKDSDKYSKMAKETKDVYNEMFLKKRGSIDSVYYDRDSEAANAISLCVGLVPDTLRENVVKSLADGVLKNGNTAGDVGFRYVIEALSDSGKDSLIYWLATNDERPSYAYQIKKGATSLTESWQALPTVSNNHLMLGHLMQWLYGGVGGIRQADDSSGWDHIIINPRMVKSDFSCTTSLMTPHGMVRCEYTFRGGNLNISVDIPKDSRATILLPNGYKKDVSEGHYNF